MAIKIQLYSDLHIEFGEFEANIGQADILVFAGDIHTRNRGLDWLNRLDTRKPIIYVLGNHEYYREAYPRILQKLNEKNTSSHIHLLENRAVTIEGITFHGATLWTDFNLFGNPRLTGAECQQYMNDYRKIRKWPAYSKLRSIDTALIHKSSRQWLEKSLATSTTEKNIVVTHHAPSLKSSPAHLHKDVLTAAYVSELEDLIEKHLPDLWLHGHIHTSSDYNIATCRVVCNPRGYVTEPNLSFTPELLIEI